MSETTVAEQLGLGEHRPPAAPDVGIRPGETDPAANPAIPAIPRECPRCHLTARQRFYGPCAACRAELRGDSTAEVVVPPAYTRRRVRAVTARATGWLDWLAGELLTDAGERQPAGVCPPVAGVLTAAERAGVARVYVTGPRPHAGDPDAWDRWAHGELGEGWTVEGHYLDRPDAPVLRWAHVDGRRVELLRAAGWWGEDAGPAACRDAWHALGEQLADRWAGFVLLTTPATTGRELVSWSIPGGVEWPTLPDHLAELVRATTGQGRIEFRRPAGDELPRLVEVDGRTMYGALCQELPGGEVEHGRGEHRHGPYARARVRASWRVPDGWAHLGLLPTRRDGGWCYPERPGERADGWLDGVELHLARRHGWEVEVHEHLVWPHHGTGPLDGWAKRLLAIIDGAGVYGPTLGRLVARGARRILIDTVGALVGRPQRVTRSVPIARAGEVPAGAILPRVEGERVLWTELRPPAWPDMVHPEWSAAVWARCRVRMLDGPSGEPGLRTGALHVPVEHVVAVRTDALYLTVDPRWPDDTRAGRLRVKAVHEGPLPAPATAPALLALRDTLGGR